MNNYHIYEEIGRGNGSVVYKGRKKKTVTYVAIKSVEKHLKQRVLNEVYVQYSLDHPNILQFINWYETNKHVWLILEYCTGTYPALCYTTSYCSTLLHTALYNPSSYT